jgi:hypothetical protein
MKQFIIAALCALTLTAGGCKKDSSTPPPTTDCVSANDFSFPANATKFSATLYSQCATAAVGAEFYVKLVLYNVTEAFGAATEFSVPANVEILGAELGPLFAPTSDVLALGGLVNNNTAYAFGITYKAGTNRSATGSGVLVKLRCRGLAAGAATFVINRTKLEIKRSDGTPIANFNNILVENVTVTIQ